jgi:hypothetical protein
MICPQNRGSFEGFVTVILFWCGVAVAEVSVAFKFFFRERVASPALQPPPPPNLEDQVSIFISPGPLDGPVIPQAPSTHFSRLLRHVWATVGLFYRSTHGMIEYLIVRKWSVLRQDDIHTKFHENSSVYKDKFLPFLNWTQDSEDVGEMEV